MSSNTNMVLFVREFKFSPMETPNHNLTEFCECATGVIGKIDAASATAALNDIYFAFRDSF
jgi:hypothetical protein